MEATYVDGDRKLTYVTNGLEALINPDQDLLVTKHRATPKFHCRS